MRLWREVEPDGRTRIRIHQSALGDSDLCLERFRLGIIGAAEDGPSDASAVGTGLHAAAESCIDFLIEYGYPLSLDDCLDIAELTFEEEMQLPGARWVKRGPKGAATYMARAVGAWYRDTLPTLRPLHTEVAFGPYTIYEDDKVIIDVAGSIDYVDELIGLVDWKTGSKHGWDAASWEKQRWSVQSTMYTYGWYRLLQDTGSIWLDVPVPFTFIVYLDNGQVLHVPTTRGHDDWNWLAEKIRNLVPLLLSDLERWPTNDQHALCSPKWCPFWDQCKGKHYPPSWPK